MPQYLVCNYMPDDFDPSTVTEAMIEEIHALNREMSCRRHEVRLRNFPGRRRQDAAGPARRQGARRRRAVHRDKGAHGRILDIGMRRSRRGTRMGAQGRRLPRCSRRGARASFLPGSRIISGIVSPAVTSEDAQRLWHERASAMFRAGSHPEGKGEDQ